MNPTQPTRKKIKANAKGLNRHIEKEPVKGLIISILDFLNKPEVQKSIVDIFFKHYNRKIK